MSAHRSLIDRTFWRPVAGQFLHMCPFVSDVLIDENDDAIIHCRCYSNKAFLDAQDRKAVEIDTERRYG